MDCVSICVPTPLSKTKDPDISYILSAVEEENLVRRKKWRAYLSAAGVFAIFVALVLMNSIRAPFAG